MRKLFGLLAAFVLVAGMSAPANAAVVSFTGTLTIVIAGLPGVPAPGAGFATINSSGGASKPITHLSLPAGAFGTAINVPLPNVFPIVGLGISVANGTVASFSSGASPCGTAHPLVTCSGGGQIHGRAGLIGSALVGLFNTGSVPVANLTVPLSVVGAASTAFASSIGITLMLSAAGWTTGTIGVISPSTISMASSTLTVMGSQGTNTAGTGNQITLVTPLQIFTNATGGFLPSFLTWRINLLGTKTPEPGMMLLLGSGALGLAIYGRRRMKK